MMGETLPRFPDHETPFEITVDRRGESAIVRLAGSCTMTVSSELADTMRSLGGEGFRTIVVELSDLDFIESSGLGGIVAGYLKTRLNKGEMKIVNPAPDIRKLLEMTRLVQLFGVFPSVEAALKS